METRIIELLTRCCESYSVGNTYLLTEEDLEVAEALHIYDTVEVTDQVYDRMYYEAKKLMPDHGFFNKVNKSDSGYGTEVDLSVWPAGSMEELKEGELDKWKQQIPYLISAKLDGCSLVLFYKNGKLDVASTRGDGLTGFDVTRHVIKCKVPQQLYDCEDDNVIVRGELIISKDDWKLCKEELLKTYKKSFANARNTIAGFLNAKETNEIVAKYASFLAYAIYNGNHERDEDEKFIDLQEYGFEVPKYYVFDHKEFNESSLQNIIKNLKDDYDFICDGVIITALEGSVLQGYEGSTLNPKRSRKYKVGMADEAVITTVKNVRWQLSKDSYLKPVVEIEPVELDGATVSNVTANNYATVVDYGLGPGAVIKVKRSGMVIPFIDGVINKVEPQLPDLPYILTDTGVDALYSGDNITLLQEIYTQKLAFACKALDIDMAGEGNLKKIVKEFNEETDQLMEFIDLIRTSEDTLVSIIGKNGKKLYKSLHTKLESITEPELFDAMSTFGRLIGKSKLQKIYDAYGTLDVNYNDLISLEGFSDITAKKYVENLENYRTIKQKIENLGSVKIVEKQQLEIKSDKLKDYNVCFTGVRSQELTKIIQENGGLASDNWNKGVNLLVAKDPSSNSGKAKKAREKDIPIMSLYEALEMLTKLVF